MPNPATTFRPSAANYKLIENLRVMALKEKRSLNNYIEVILTKHVQENEAKI